MSESYGPKAFEKKWVKLLTGFNETKVFFFHDRDKTTVKYIKGNRLLGVEMYRSDYEIEYWLGHFQHYLVTGVFDTNAYWVIYDAAGEEDTVFPIPMKLKNKLWSVHGPEHSKFMRDERAKEGRQGIGFKQVPRPSIVECKWCGNEYSDGDINEHQETCDYIIPEDIRFKRK